MTRIVWVKHGDKNCKCAADDCTPSEWQWGAVYSFYKTTTTTTSTTSTMTTTTTGGPTFQEGGAGCCRDSAGLSPAYSHERLFKRPIWDQSYGYYVSPPWSSLEELEESIQSNCLREPTCSGYQKLSCTTSWMEGGKGILVSHQNAMSDTIAIRTSPTRFATTWGTAVRPMW